MKLHEFILSLQYYFKKYHLDEVEKIPFLEEFYYSNVSFSSSISYQITSLLIAITSYSEIDELFNESEIYFLEENQKLTTQEIYFIQDALKLCHLAGEIYDYFFDFNIKHPVLEQEYWKEKMCLAQEDYLAAFYNLYTSVVEEQRDSILEYMDQFDHETLDIYEPYYETIVAPQLKQAIHEKSMKDFLNILSNYIHLKICLESGVSIPIPETEDMQSKGPLVCSKIDEYVNQNFPRKYRSKSTLWDDVIGNLKDQNEQEIETFVEILKNRSLAQKSFYYYYSQASCVVEEYLEKCKKM